MSENEIYNDKEIAETAHMVVTANGERGEAWYWLYLDDLGRSVCIAMALQDFQDLLEAHRQERSDSFMFEGNDLKIARLFDEDEPAQYVTAFDNARLTIAFSGDEFDELLDLARQVIAHETPAPAPVNAKGLLN
jgi:hypothetical protein